MVLTPVVDVARDPRWGRVEETYGEDVYLVSEMGLAAVRGFQGKTLPLAPDKVLATLEHFVADSESVNGTNTGPALISERALREVFLRPFERVVKELSVRSIMVTYNELDGLPCTANPWLLTDVLRGEWGFQGMTVSDYKAIKELHALHQLESSLGNAAARAIIAGVDVEFPDPDTYPLLKERLAQNKVSMERINEAVSRVIAAKLEAGTLFLQRAPMLQRNAYFYRS
jgi:beta-glucosidase